MQVSPVTGTNQVWQVRGAGQGSVSRVKPVGGPLAQPRLDTVSISPQARMNQMMEVINEQKRSVVEQRNSLIGHTLEKGERLDTIEAQLEAFDEKLQLLDESLASLQADQVRQVTENLKNPKEEKAPETEDEQQLADMEQLSDTAARLDQAKTLQSVSAKIQGQSQVQEQQIKLDSDRVRIRQPHVGDNAAGNQYISDKRVKLTAMRAQATAAYRHFSSVAEGLRNTSSPVPAKPLPEKASATPPVEGEEQAGNDQSLLYQEQESKSLDATA